MNRQEFDAKAQKVADETNLELISTYADGTFEGFVEDDGILHVSNGGFRAAFDVSNNQADSAKVQKQKESRVKAAWKTA